MQTIPLQAVPNQTLTSLVNNQSLNINVYDKASNLYIDIFLNGDLIVSNVICRDLAPIICREYLGFNGNLMFVDNQGNSDPVYTELGTRYQLVYFTEEEYALI